MKLYKMPRTRQSNKSKHPGRTGSGRTSGSQKRKSGQGTAQNGQAAVVSTDSASSQAVDQPGATDAIIQLLDARLGEIEKRLETKIDSRLGGNIPAEAGAAKRKRVSSPTPVSRPQSESEAEEELPLDGLAATAIQALMSGEDNPVDQQVIPNFQSLDRPLSSRVDPMLKNKIWAHKFVEMDALLSRQNNEVTFRLSDSTHQSRRLSVETTTKDNQRLSIERWTSAFLVYAAVMVERQPESSPGLFKYLSVVRKMADHNKAWSYYDREFRIMYQGNMVPWGSVHQELYLEACEEYY